MNHDSIIAFLILLSAAFMLNRYQQRVKRAIGTLQRENHILRHQLADALREVELLQDILDQRPAINAGLPDTYIRWSQSIYSGDIARAQLNHKRIKDDDVES